ncbi:terminase small subunit [Paracoccus aestuariivivens]|uniref:Terminase small subunit n=1 Tax=Paracoccus aestuariivivens TaxID=1820333 RepID=A0A6L6JHP9_9RHOB|nr:terminase small subunit [Paracoccus aestuariivivens]MTH79411.1 terminase small subunit [Paracoccus aestuariivivens]
MATARKGKLVSRADLANIFGVTPPTVDRWVVQGCPVAKEGGRGRAYQFNTADIREWRDQVIRDDSRSTSEASENELLRRELAAKTETAELKLAQLKREVAPIEQFERALSMVFAEVRAKMRTIPSRAAPRVVGENDLNHVKATLKEEIDLALDALSEDRILSADDLEAEDDEEDDD